MNAYCYGTRISYALAENMTDAVDLIDLAPLVKLLVDKQVMAGVTIAT